MSTIEREECWAATMRVCMPWPGIMAFYDGRIENKRLYSQEANWLDDGAYSLGTATYVIYQGIEAVVYDTHMSLRHAAFIRHTLQSQGITDIRVVMSHWHTDHVAGNGAFSDCEIIACDLTRALLSENRERLETGKPPIKPVVMPTATFHNCLTLHVGTIELELRQLDIHSADGVVVKIPSLGLVLAGDTLEDTLTYVTEPDRLDTHLKELARFKQWHFQWLLPNHGRYEIIELGGYPRELIDATEKYVAQLIRLKTDSSLANLSLKEFAAESLATGAVAWFEPYEAVHRHNVEQVLALEGTYVDY